MDRSLAFMEPTDVSNSHLTHKRNLVVRNTMCKSLQMNVKSSQHMNYQVGEEGAGRWAVNEEMTGGCWEAYCLEERPIRPWRGRSQGLRPPRAHSCQGNCAVILTLHCLNFALRSLDPSLFLYLSLSLVEAEEKLGSALCSNDVSSPEEASVCWISTASLQSPRLDQGLVGGPGGWWRRINYTQ